MENPANTILEISTSYAVPRCLHAVTELGVADALDEAPRSASELAASTGASAEALSRMLRVLSAYGIFERCDGGYTHTPASRLLRADHPQSLRSYVRLLGFDVYWRMFEFLDHSLRTGETALEKVLPEGQWAYLAKHPERSRIFDEAMTGKAHGQIAGILANYDFSKFKTIADIGGGQGHLLRAVLDAAPHAKGVLFDLPNVVERSAGSAPKRMQLQAGDFFKDSLPVCDAYLIMQVIHDWSDDRAVEILKAIRKSAPAHAKLLLIESVVPDNTDPDWIKMLDIFMLALFNGKERTQSEFEKLLSAAGFRLDRVMDVGLATSLLEASVN